MKLKMILFTLLLITYNYTHTNDATELYLELIKKCLINSIYQDPGCKPGDNNAYKNEIRENGLDWPQAAHTMIGLKRLNNIEFCVKDVLKNNIPGDFIETGVWRGGATIFMRALLKVHNDTTRSVWVADSFEGLPAPKPSLYPADTGIRLHEYKQLAISLEQVKNNFKRYDLLDNQVKFLKGWFCDTLPNAPIKELAILRLDGDLYESTMDALVNLYHKLSIGGYIIIDDYSMEFCRQAVHDFRNKFNITETIEFADHTAAFWKKLE